MAVSPSGVLPEAAGLDKQRRVRPATLRSQEGGLAWVRHYVLGEGLFRDALFRERKK